MPIDDLADVFIDVCDDALVEIGVSDVEIILVDAAVVVSEFAVPVSSCVGDALTGILVGILVITLTGV